MDFNSGNNENLSGNNENLSGNNENLSGRNDRSTRQYVENSGLGDNSCAGQQRVGLDDSLGTRTGGVGGAMESLTGTKGQAYEHSRGHSNVGDGGVLGDGGGTRLHGAHGSQNTTGKPTMGDKVKGTFEELKGKVTKNPEVQLQGQARKQGELSSGQNLSGGTGVGY
ncbi:hypothetical protein CROQUDRAFT_696093 [Cronartium quercuum f. sp. fusiforme G11]|uniref:Uncharacterized protein n=1 Tax=Cronartium quercuum f. sp. fusiforme G11 TaxID=708437 RepID=A0A9P6NQY9_9BASI|nr:hypothetical protein CROQUDRAFT_696093 [Cronartium quercuum f. sp. fusiforme G11]